LHSDILSLLNIRSERYVVIDRLPEGGAWAEPQGRCRVDASDVVVVREIIRAVTGEGIACEANEVLGPFWLVDLSVRLAMGEMVVFANPGRMWEATVNMLSDRGVQAFVIAPGEPARKMGVGVVAWPL
jgi:hypothetical protein